MVDGRFGLDQRLQRVLQDRAQPGTLGHQNIQTTQRYLGSELDLADAACDRLGIRLDA